MCRLGRAESLDRPGDRHGAGSRRAAIRARDRQQAQCRDWLQSGARQANRRGGAIRYPRGSATGARQRDQGRQAQGRYTHGSGQFRCRSRGSHRREVELGIVVITQILTTPGVELVGPLPAEIKITTTFGGAVSTNSNAPEAARALLQFLRTEEVVKVIRKQGMTPVS